MIYEQLNMACNQGPDPELAESWSLHSQGHQSARNSTPEPSGQQKSLAPMQTHQLYMLRFGNWLLRIAVEILWAFIQPTQTDLPCSRA